MKWPFGRRQDNSGDDIDQAMAVVEQLLTADISEKRAILERERRVLLTSNAIVILYLLVHALDQKAQEDFAYLRERSAQEREFRMVNLGEGINHQAMGQYKLLHLNLLRDARDQDTRIAFIVFEKMRGELFASGMMSGEDSARVKASLTSDILTLDEQATAQALIDLQKAIIQHGTLEATRAVLLQRRGVLLDGLAEYLIENDNENMRAGTLPANDPDTVLMLNDWYRDLLRGARQTGIPNAWPQFQERMLALQRQHGAGQ